MHSSTVATRSTRTAPAPQPCRVPGCDQRPAGHLGAHRDRQGRQLDPQEQANIAAAQAARARHEREVLCASACHGISDGALAAGFIAALRDAVLALDVQPQEDGRTVLVGSAELVARLLTAAMDLRPAGTR